MSDEKKLILKMLKEGKINEEEALKLLDAIKDPKSGQNFKEPNKINFDTKDFENKIEKFAQNLAGGIDSMVQKATEKIRNIQLDYDFDMSYGGDSIISFGNMKSKINKEYYIEVEEGKNLSVNIDNFNGDTKVKPWDKDEILIKAQIKYNDRYVEKDHEFVKYYFDGDILYIKADSREIKKDAFSVNMDIFVPEKTYETFNLGSVNGRIGVEELNINELTSRTVNGGFWASNIETSFIHAKTVNGSIELEATRSKDIELESVNGGIDIMSIEGENLDVQTVNGNLSFEGVNNKYIQLRTVNGSISLEGDFNETSFIDVKSVNGTVNIESKSFKNALRIICQASGRVLDKINLPANFKIVERSRRELIAETANYSEEANKLDVEIKIQNGRINVNI